MTDTRRYYSTRPLVRNIDISHASLRHVMKGYKQLRDELQANENQVSAVPEKEALWFYVQQHALSLIDRELALDEPVGKYKKFLDSYHDSMHWKTLRMFYYLLLICTRESRHAGGTKGKMKVYNMHPELKHFHKTYVQDSSAESAINAIIDNAPDVTLGEYTQFLVRMFTYPSYNGGFGGKAWKEVAIPLNEFVQGNISATIMMDTAFTLAHNNGPIFNKGMLYSGYNSTAIKKILDVQRSGQIPQLIAHHYNDLDKFITTDMVNYVSSFAKLNSGFTGRVDWTQVKDIHGYACYKAEIAAQEAADPKAGWKEKLKAKIAKAKAEAAKLALLKGSYEILPGVFVPKSKRSQK